MMLSVHIRAAWAGFLILLSAGCGSPPEIAFESLDLEQPREQLTEFSLGEYRIPIPVVVDKEEVELSYRHRFEFDFSLYALVSPSEHSHVADAWERHEGKIRDEVIRICRNATVDELQEPELATLKARLLDALAGPIGGDGVRQLLFTEVVSQEL